MAPGKGYVLMTDFTTHPDAFPALGAVIQDPLRPNDTAPLSVLTEQPGVTAHPDKHKTVRSSAFELHGSIWAQFCQNMFRAKIGADVGNDTVTTFETKKLETRYMTKAVDPNEVRERAKTSNVQDAMNVGGLIGKPVFMISGLKVARGFKHSTVEISKHVVDTAAEAQATEQVSVGGAAGGSSRVGYQEEVNSLPAPENDPGKHDIIFAYQLHIIARKAWWEFWKKKGMTVKRYEPEGGFSSIGQAKEDQEVDSLPASLDMLQAVVEENGDFVESTDICEEIEAKAENFFCVTADL
jgi:hypothetical protein